MSERTSETVRDLARAALELASSASPAPWRACKDGACSCKNVWSVGADYPIAALNHGEWGDEYEAYRVVDIEDDLPGSKAIEPYIERIAYGFISDSYATADARFIAFARTALPALAAEVLRLATQPATSETPASAAPSHVQGDSESGGAG